MFKIALGTIINYLEIKSGKTNKIIVCFIGYILVDKNISFSGHWLFRDIVIQILFHILLQNIYSSMERIVQGKICNILLKKGKILKTWKILATL
jgi:hypothetical protein